MALDTANKVYNLEIQQENEGALPKRPRYHASLLDANILEPGTEFQNLPCTTVIFITKNDVLGGGLPIYHISRTVREVEADFGDELDIIYVNAVSYTHLKGKTVVMIAHRLSSVTNADRIFVLKDGEIEESGTHESLEKANGLYAHMWEKYNQSVCWLSLIHI